MRAPAALLPILLLLPLLAAGAPAAPPAPPVPRNDVVLEVHDLRDLFRAEGAASPVFTSREAADAWVHRVLDVSCWSEGIPETFWQRGGILSVRAVPAAQERLKVALRDLRAAAR